MGSGLVEFASGKDEIEPRATPLAYEVIPLAIEADSTTKNFLQEFFIEHPKLEVPEIKPKYKIHGPGNKVEYRTHAPETKTAIEYKIQIITPDPTVDYKILKVEPKPGTEFKIRILDPKTREELNQIDPAIKDWIAEQLKENHESEKE